jgi:ferredoxin--NADP+ reductase
MRLVRNELYATEAGTLRPKATNKFEDLDVGLVFRSIGYRGIPIYGVPYNDNWGVIYNVAGRVIRPETKEFLVGEYAAGWIKRGPSGVIGTNKPDAVETVENMVKDFRVGKYMKPSEPDASALEQLIRLRQPDYFSYEDWLFINDLEKERGAAIGRPRVKFTTIEEMVEAKKNRE